MKSPIRQSKVDEPSTLTACVYFRLGEVERTSAPGKLVKNRGPIPCIWAFARRASGQKEFP